MRQQRTAEEIEELVNGYRRRGEMTRRAYCESQGITLSGLDYYLRRYSRPATRLAKVSVKPALVEPSGRFTLMLGNGRRIECGEAELAGLIRIAEAM